MAAPGRFRGHDPESSGQAAHGGSSGTGVALAYPLNLPTCRSLQGATSGRTAECEDVVSSASDSPLRARGNWAPVDGYGLTPPPA
jgi:hypothetical protein